jgi:prolipoprotein diacylglyceryltransferase
MWQVLFHIGPVPIYGFGLMLMITGVVCYWLTGKRAEQQGIPKQYAQDLTVWIFIGGLIGARIVWMFAEGGVTLATLFTVQTFKTFFRIWDGGIVFYGSALGGTAAFFLAYFLIIKKYGLSILQLGDVLAPGIALGLSIGRIGCLLNGCCYGQVACPDCLSVHFPLSAPARYTLVQAGLQTAAGFSTENRPSDPRSLVTHVEPGSRAEQSGLRPGDVIVEVGGIPNQQKYMELWGSEEALERLSARLGLPQRKYVVDAEKQVYGEKYEFSDQTELDQALQAARQAQLKNVDVYDGLWEHLVNAWPRGETTLALAVQHADGRREHLPPFSPKTVGLHPTQLYETVSTFLIFLLLLAYAPFQKRKGELLVILMLCYAVHRFINESLRNDTAKFTPFGPSAALTLSQWGSIVLFIGGLALLFWLVRQRMEPALPGSKSTPSAVESIPVAE